MFCEEAVTTNFKVYGVTQQKMEPKPSALELTTTKISIIEHVASNTCIMQIQCVLNGNASLMYLLAFTL